MTENPYEPPAESSTELAQRGLRCPYCQETFRLTWTRYLWHPLGVQECPDCGRRSRLHGNVGSQIALGAISIFGGLASWAVAEYSSLLGFVGFAALLLIIVMTDRWIDENCELRPLKQNSK